MRIQAEVTAEEGQRWESRAPGWQIRCLKCGFTEPWGKYGIRLGAVGKKYTVGFCSHCRWLRFHVVEKRQDAEQAAVSTAAPVNDPNPADETVPCSMQCPTRCTIRFRPGTVIKRRLAIKRPAGWWVGGRL
jgi:hypothetical protein